MSKAEALYKKLLASVGDDKVLARQLANGNFSPIRTQILETMNHFEEQLLKIIGDDWTVFHDDLDGMSVKILSSKVFTERERQIFFCLFGFYTERLMLKALAQLDPGEN